MCSEDGITLKCCKKNFTRSRVLHDLRQDPFPLKIELWADLKTRCEANQNRRLFVRPRPHSSAIRLMEEEEKRKKILEEAELNNRDASKIIQILRKSRL